MGIICVAEAQDIDLPPLDPSVFIDSPKVTPIPSEQSSDPIPVAEEPDDLILPQPKSLTPSTQPSSSSRVERIPVAEEVPAAQLPPSRQAAQVPVIPKVSSELVEQNRTQVAVLGYHDFSEEKPVTEMRIRTSVFRRQMQALKDAGMPIITMKEFWEWKNGDRKLPEFCILITIDDGWKSVYTDAFPILKEMGFPFTLFPYTHYLTGRGASLSIEELWRKHRESLDEPLLSIDLEEDPEEGRRSVFEIDRPRDWGVARMVAEELWGRRGLLLLPRWVSYARDDRKVAHLRVPGSFHGDSTQDTQGNRQLAIATLHGVWQQSVHFCERRDIHTPDDRSRAGREPRGPVGSWWG
jgi:hypothetical protein